jgi:hypothetical protein
MNCERAIYYACIIKNNEHLFKISNRFVLKTAVKATINSCNLYALIGVIVTLPEKFSEPGPHNQATSSFRTSESPRRNVIRAVFKSFALQKLLQLFSCTPHTYEINHIR